MIKQEKIIINGRELVKTFSDAGKYIIQNETKTKYAEAIDIPNKYTYTESMEDIPVEADVQLIDEQQPI